MRKLRYLDLENTSFEDIHAQTLPSTLVCLWLNNMSFADFVLDHSYHKCLAVLSLQNCRRLSGLIDTFGQLSSLQVLSIVAVGLNSLPDSFGNLSNLMHLTISICGALKELPKTFGNSVALKDLSLDRCSALLVFPDSFGGLSRLTRLTIDDCPCLHQLPDTFLQLQKLEQLGLFRTALQSIPNLENLQSLRILTVDWCVKQRFPSLPKCFGQVITRENYNKGHFTFAVDGAHFTLRKYQEFSELEMYSRSL